MRPGCPSPTSTPEELERRALIQRNDLLLHEAVIKNDTEGVRRILKEPVDINSRNNVSEKKTFLVFTFAILVQILNVSSYRVNQRIGINC
jgi:hypothetical protein